MTPEEIEQKQQQLRRLWNTRKFLNQQILEVEQALAAERQLPDAFGDGGEPIFLTAFAGPPHLEELNAESIL